ncbi:MAG TPA: DUF935 family protein [Ignavibacteria bacterium]|nr:DUF935 family protein [Ignavibacteria bacterium]
MGNKLIDKIKGFFTASGKVSSSEKPDKKYGDADSVKTTSLKDPIITSLMLEDFSNLSTDRLKIYLENARQGFPFFMYKLFSVIRQRDLRIGTLVQRRKFAVLSEEWEIEVKEWEEGKEFVEELLSGINKLNNFFTDIVEANCFGVKLFEINYTAEAGRIIIRNIKSVLNYLYVWDDKNDEYKILDSAQVDGSKLMKWSTDAYSNNLKLSDMPFVELPPEKFLEVFSLDGDEDNTFMNGVTISFILAYFFKSFTFKDMMIYVERYASPTIKALYQTFSPDNKRQMEKAVKDVRVHGGIVAPAGSDINYMSDESKESSGNLFMNVVHFINAELTLRMLGEKETTEMGDSGSYGALKIKKYVSDDITFADMILIQETVNELIERSIRMNFANPPEIPKFKFIKVKSLEDKKLLVDILQVLFNMGYKSEVEELEGLFDIKLVEVVKTNNNENNDNPDIKLSQTEVNRFMTLARLLKRKK